MGTGASVVLQTHFDAPGFPPRLPLTKASFGSFASLLGEHQFRISRPSISTLRFSKGSRGSFANRCSAVSVPCLEAMMAAG